MKTSKRDLLVLFNQELMTPQSIEEEMNCLNEFLYKVEQIDNFVGAHELIDLNDYKITSSAVEIKKIISSKKRESFMFLSNKN